MPATIRALLNRLRRRERLLGFAWAAARAVTACVLLLLACCGVDWLLDRWGTTPRPLRVGLFVVQCVAALFGLGLIAWPLVRRWTDDRLALWIESAVPSLGHRLISAVQLNRAGAKTAGMSPDLIAATTRQAEERAAEVEVAKVAEGKRYTWAGMLVTPVLLLAAASFAAAPETAKALLSRQLLSDAEIPRRVHLASHTRAVWPVGEEGVIRVVADGLYDGEEPTGSVRIEPDKGRPFSVPLVRDGTEFVATVPPGDGEFTFRAWLADGRFKRPEKVRYAPRPVVQTIEAWVQIPTAIAKRADGSPYEEKQRGGDVQYRLDGSRVRVAITSQVPLASARLSAGGAMTVSADGRSADGTFAPEGVGVYEVYLTSRDELDGVDPPKRGVRRVPLEVPDVSLLAETVATGDEKADDFEIEGIPVLEGERFRSDYRATHRYGLSHAVMRFRVVPLGAEDDGKTDAARFDVLPLGPGRGAAEASPELRREFGTSSLPDALPDTEGRGRYDFNVGGLPDGKGGTRRLRKGDRIQFYIEVFSKAAPDGPPGRSAVREKEVVDQKGYLTWLERKDDLKEKARALEEAARTTPP